MKSKLLTLAGALGLLALLGHFYAKPLMAQVRAALVQNVDEPARHVWTFNGYSAFDNTYTVPAGQTLVIEEVGSLCGASVWTIYIDPSSSANRGSFYFAAGNSIGALAQHSRIYVRAGQTFNINEYPDRGDLFSIHGYLLPN
jgi:hypothetical protein